MTPCTGAGCGTNEYCATIPKNEVEETGVAYYVYAEDNYGTQGWYGTPENPEIISFQQVVLSTSNPVYVGITNYANAKVECGAILPTDRIEAFFINDCGDPQLAGYGSWDGVFGNIWFYIFGNSNPSGGYKDGFDPNEVVQLKLVRDGVDYLLKLPQEIRYNYPMPIILSGAVAAEQPKIEVFGNNNSISNGSNTPSINNNTNFGVTTSAVSNSFTIDNTGCDDLKIKYISVSDPNNFIVNCLVEYYYCSRQFLYFRYRIFGNSHFYGSSNHREQQQQHLLQFYH